MPDPRCTHRIAWGHNDEEGGTPCLDCGSVVDGREFCYGCGTPIEAGWCDVCDDPPPDLDE